MNSLRKAKVYFSHLDFKKLSGKGYEIDALIDSLPSFRKKKALQYHKMEDKLRSVYVWKLLEKTMHMTFMRDIKKESIDFNCYGKPFFTGNNKIHFNLSHSGEIVACIIDLYPVGVDVEFVSPIDLSEIFGYFSEMEIADLLGLPAQEQIDYFYKLWTIKECYIKMRGKGLSLPLNSLSFKLNNNSIDFNGGANSFWNFALHNINIGLQSYKLSFCAFRNRVSNKIVHIPYNMLY